MIIILAWAGFAFTVLGSFLLAGDRKEGWVSYIVANILWAIVALSTGQIPLLAQMCVLTIPALLGVRNSGRRKDN
jgi:nicotinamide riboside transporter PnuC